MDETLMIRYIREIWAPHTHKTRSLLVLDSFKVHATDSTAKEFKAKSTVTTIIPGGCTSKIQPLDVSKPHAKACLSSAELSVFLTSG